ncbi:MAG: recombinase family protein [Paracoccaceae bacterium]
MAEKSVSRRCAIYVRKSSEEGLDMSYNSLEAQSDACKAYIASQRHEGWVPQSRIYEDGGYSGGNMDRPGLQQLLEDVAKGLIDIIVVYKIDRLTRSLTDFAKLNDVLDHNHVSFVAVTQQFNTSTSMGRLTLNVLLSFAQFEREVSGERIRDKVAASKRKGMWMGGPVPLGYQVHQRKLMIVPSEAEIVRNLFARYLELRSIHGLQRELEQQGVRSRLRTGRSGNSTGGVVLGPGAIRHMLKNPLYIGVVHFKGEHYSGEHEAIIDREQYDRVQRMLTEQRNGNNANPKRKTGALLKGIAFDGNGRRLQPNFAIKKGLRYHYYTSALKLRNTEADQEGIRVPAGDLERLVLQAVADRIENKSTMHDWMRLILPPGDIASRLATFSELSDELRSSANIVNDRLLPILERVVLSKTTLTIQLSASGLARLVDVNLEPPQTKPEDGAAELFASENGQDHLLIGVNSHLLRCGKQMKLILGTEATADREPDPRLVVMVAKARTWFDGLKSGRYPSLKHIAAEEGYDNGYVGKLCSLAFLAPDMVERILTGNHSSKLTPERLRKACPLPSRWNDQRAMLLD